MQIFIEVPDAERQQFITALEELSAASEVYAAECLDILVARYGAKRTAGGREVFHCMASGRIARGEALMPPGEAVEKAICIWRPEYLGLPTPTVAEQLAAERP